ncbi:isoprenylcysteine carboxyl methyltransferase family protein [Roseinatronobacter sp.]|uniref:isoprenylcysteine carboxyl methyltransferase family protein n=1 Tax=Roseinatronobacter sp. TaxID=1945755 RepID=UPI0025F30777|nr:isoprenylcysteine carboxylmethyltransferase family protein [Roseibaca sp.]
MTPALWFLVFIIAQRLSELVIAKRNTTRLLAQGATEHGAAHYPAMVAMHSAWIVALVVFGWNNPVSWPWLAVFAVLQVFRLWILVTLGPRWTTRIIVLPEPLVARGPFRFMHHPNYALVVAEIIVASMVLGLVWVAALWTVLNAAMLWVRIRAEDRALAPLR